MKRVRLQLSSEHYMSWVHQLVLGPVALVMASLIDLYLVTRVFVIPKDPLAGVLTFFLFGATIGVPLQIWFARSVVGRTLDGRHRADAPPTSGRVAAAAGILAAIATVAWLYCLRVADAAVVFPLANLTPLIFAFVEGAQGRIRLRHAVAPLLLFILGFCVFSTPGTADMAGLTSVVLVVLVIRNVVSAGAEVAERSGTRGSAAHFTAIRFVWLAGVGVPIAFTVAIATGRLAECMALAAKAMPLALPLHAGTMLLTFIGSVRRTQAKATRPLTICAAVFATPLVLAPLVAAGINEFALEIFPTITGSLRLTIAAALVVSAAMWLSALRPQPQTYAAGHDAAR